MKTFLLGILLPLAIFTANAQANKLSEKYDLMPWPKNITENGQKFIIRKNFTIAVENPKNDRIAKGTTSFLRRLSGRTGVFIDEGFALQSSEVKNPSLVIKYDRVGKLQLNEDESYQLAVTSQKITLTAITDIGAIRGLETLLQLTSSNKKEYFFYGVTIKDAPRFPWRGLMIDVSRHFEPINVLKRNLDAMASVKLNVFHWHLSDDQGFRVQVNAAPKLHQLASDGQYYTHPQIRDIVKYASDLGIRVMPEFDVPGHASAWLTAYPEIGSAKTTYKIERYAGVFNPTLDPTNPKTYQILAAVFSEIAPLFPDKYFHIGGDENNGRDWNENPKIQAFKKKHHLKTNHELQNYFNVQVQKILKKNHKIMMGWDEILTPDLPKDVVIQSWRGKESMVKAAKQGYKTILSQGYYIDLLLSVKHHYTNDPIEENSGLSEREIKNILGGETTMWGELVTPLTIDSRIWPRTAAIAERFWSPRHVKDIPNMLKRLQSVSARLEELGITHIKNRDVILRNISKHQDISSLINLTKICEPLKYYKRNKGGTAYKSFSPFTQFADACTTDASDALRFNELVDLYLKNPTRNPKTKIASFFVKWTQNNIDFAKINTNPTLAVLSPLSENLSQMASLLSLGLNKGKLSTENYQKATALLKKLSFPTADTELAILSGLKKMIHSLK